MHADPSKINRNLAGRVEQCDVRQEKQDRRTTLGNGTAFSAVDVGWLRKGT
jgi:hypothetical protein